MAERVFAQKLESVGFSDVRVLDRQSFGLADAARYPLFTPELIELMRRSLPSEQHHEVAIAVTFEARKSEVSAQ